MDAISTYSQLNSFFLWVLIMSLSLIVTILALRGLRWNEEYTPQPSSSSNDDNSDIYIGPIGVPEVDARTGALVHGGGYPGFPWTSLWPFGGGVVASSPSSPSPINIRRPPARSAPKTKPTNFANPNSFWG